jgi:hypothetical protein
MKLHLISNNRTISEPTAPRRTSNIPLLLILVDVAGSTVTNGDGQLFAQDDSATLFLAGGLTARQQLDVIRRSVGRLADMLTTDGRIVTAPELVQS